MVLALPALLLDEPGAEEFRAVVEEDTDDFLSRYAPGGAMSARYEALSLPGLVARRVVAPRRNLDHINPSQRAGSSGSSRCLARWPTLGHRDVGQPAAPRAACQKKRLT